MNTDQALLELSLMNAEEKTASYDDFFIWGTEKGIPIEILTRMKAVWQHTKTIAGEVVSIGKIIITSIVDFFKANTHLTVGLALGAAVGVLVAAIPVLGPLLAPLGTALSMAYGGGVASAIEEGERLGDATNPVVAAISLAKKFLALLISVFQAITAYLTGESASEGLA